MKLRSHAVYRDDAMVERLQMELAGNNDIGDEVATDKR